jgi:hypothetical protein
MLGCCYNRLLMLLTCTHFLQVPAAVEEDEGICSNREQADRPYIRAVFTANVQAPDAAAIRAAITDEASQRGLEHTLREERPPAAPQRRNIMLPPELLGSLDGELLQLLEQTLAGAGGNILQGLQGLRLSGSGDGSQGQQAQEEEEEEEVSKAVVFGAKALELRSS